MKQLLFNRPPRIVVAPGADVSGGCATSNAPSERSAGRCRLFSRRTADTPKKQELLKSLPADKLSLITIKGHSFYVQPAGPNSAYVGTPAEYQAYQQLRLAKQLSNDNLMAAQMNQDAMDRWGGVWGPGFYGVGRWR
jgi:hypothetical protein